MMFECLPRLKGTLTKARLLSGVEMSPGVSPEAALSSVTLIYRNQSMNLYFFLHWYALLREIFFVWYLESSGLSSQIG